MSLSQAQQERRTAAYHEAGHGVVAVALGVEYVDLTLWWRKPNDDFETHCGGGARYHFEKHKPGKLDRAAMSYAGLLAELLMDNPETEIKDYLSEYESDIVGLSPTDLIGVEALRPSWRVRAMEKSLAILKKHWIVVEDIAFELENNKDSRHSVYPSVLSAEHAERLLSPAKAETKSRMHPSALPHG